jgi:tetratricopeptide (TPR) repeat protein
MPYPPLALAEAFLAAGEIDDALATLDAHLADDPADTAARRLRADMLARRADPDSLRRALTDLDALPADDTRLIRSAVLERLGDPVAALDALGDPAPDALLERRVQLALASGDLDRARAALAHVPHWNWRWHQWAGDVALAGGELIEAHDHFMRALAGVATLADNPALAAVRAGVMLRLGHICRYRNDRAAAYAYYQIAEQIIPDDPLIPFYRGLLALLAGDLPAAGDLCRAAYDAANPALREQMRAALAEDMRYLPLKEILDR